MGVAVVEQPCSPGFRPGQVRYDDKQEYEHTEQEVKKIVRQAEQKEQKERERVAGAGRGAVAAARQAADTASEQAALGAGVRGPRAAKPSSGRQAARFRVRNVRPR